MVKRIKDRVEKTLQGWKKNLFSLGGKEVLIKAVTQAIPVYTMSCFRFPNNICSDIDMLCANFWWGTVGDKKKCHWRSWKRLCSSKEIGRMGFRNLACFNQAMLAKQS